MRINDRNIQEPVGESLKQTQIQCMLTLPGHTRQTLKKGEEWKHVCALTIFLQQ